MAKKDPVQEALTRLRALQAGPDSPELRKELTQTLGSRTNLIAAKAAQIIGELRLRDLADDLARAFDRWMAAEDRGCSAKASIAEALHAIDVDAEPVFLGGIHHVQYEAVYGGHVDVAAPLRATCAMGLAQMGSRQALIELTDLLMDKETQPRVAAARALAHLGLEHGALPLRVKVLAGDKEPAVMIECFAALLRLSSRKALPFVAKFLDSHDEEIQIAAALAIGETHSPEAFDLLRTRWETQVSTQERLPLIPAIAALRLPASLEFLIEIIKTASRGTAAKTIEAMRFYRHDEQAKARVTAAVDGRDDRLLSEALASWDAR